MKTCANLTSRKRPIDRGGSPIKEYKIILNGGEVASVSAISSPEYTIKGLKTQKPYIVTVRAVSEYGESDDSSPLLARTTAPNEPGQPESIQVIDIGGGFVTLFVAPPSDTGGVKLKEIQIWTKKDALSAATVVSGEPGQEITVYGLDHSTRYFFAAVAVNTIGLSGPESQRVKAKTGALTIPSRCPRPTVLSTTGGSVTLELHDPEDSGGSPITGFSIYVSRNGTEEYQEIKSTTDDATQRIITLFEGANNEAIEAQTRYDFKVLAQNSISMCIGDADALLSQRAIADTKDAGIPRAPPSPLLLETSASTATIQLYLPEDKNGSIVLGFYVQVGDREPEFVETNSTIEHTLYNLRAQESFSIMAAVSTDTGLTAYSEPEVGSTNEGTAPAEATNLQVVSTGSSFATISWEPPQDTGGAPLVGTSFKVCSVLF